MIYQLNFEQDLKRSIWHELGHLMVDLMIVEFDSEYFIEKFEINFQIATLLFYKFNNRIT